MSLKKIKATIYFKGNGVIKRKPQDVFELYIKNHAGVEFWFQEEDSYGYFQTCHELVPYGNIESIEYK